MSLRALRVFVVMLWRLKWGGLKLEFFTSDTVTLLKICGYPLETANNDFFSNLTPAYPLYMGSEGTLLRAKFENFGDFLCFQNMTCNTSLESSFTLLSENYDFSSIFLKSKLKN